MTPTNCLQNWSVKHSLGSDDLSCPISGKFLRESPIIGKTAVVADRELVARIADSTDLSPAEADRVIEDVLAWYREPLLDYVRRRHHQLRGLGVRNDQIWDELSSEIQHRLFAPPAVTPRQLRRYIYG